MKSFRYPVVPAKRIHSDDGLEPSPYCSLHFLNISRTSCYRCISFSLRLTMKGLHFAYVCPLIFNSIQGSSMKTYAASIAGFSAKSFSKSCLWALLSFSPFVRRTQVMPHFQWMAGSAAQLNSRNVSITCHITMRSATLFFRKNALDEAEEWRTQVHAHNLIPLQAFDLTQIRFFGLISFPSKT